MQQQNRPYLRHQRVESLIQEELSKIILKEVEFEPGMLVSITEVVVNKRLDYAKVYVSTIPEEKAEGAVALLKARTPYLGAILLRKLNIHPLPQLEFVHDKGSEHASVIEKALLDEKGKSS